MSKPVYVRGKQGVLDLEGRTGVLLHTLPASTFAGRDFLGQAWAVVKWDDEEDPETVKASGIEEYDPEAPPEKMVAEARKGFEAWWRTLYRGEPAGSRRHGIGYKSDSDQESWLTYAKGFFDGKGWPYPPKG